MTARCSGVNSRMAAPSRSAISASRVRSDAPLGAFERLAAGIAVGRPGSLDEFPGARRHDALESETRRLAPYSGWPRSVRLRPVGAVVDVHPEGDPEVPDLLHGLPH